MESAVKNNELDDEGETRGRNAYEPSAKERELVESAAAFGIPRRPDRQRISPRLRATAHQSIRVSRARSD